MISYSFLYRSPSRPFQVAIIGSGPGGCYVSEYLLRRTSLSLHIDIFDRLPIPFGLIRFGIAPHHPEVKHLTEQFGRMFTEFAPSRHMDKSCRFLGNVHIGQSLSLDWLRSHYDSVVLAYGANGETALAGDILSPLSSTEQNNGIISAKHLVDYYNVMPSESCADPTHHGVRQMLAPRKETSSTPHMSCVSDDTVLILGNGNVALDCTSLLVGPVDQLFAKTDIRHEALALVRQSGIRRIVLCGRSSAEFSAFSVKEFRELTQLEQVKVLVEPFGTNSYVRPHPFRRAISKRQTALMQQHMSSEVLTLFEKTKSISPQKTFVSDTNNAKSIYCLFNLYPTSITRLDQGSDYPLYHVLFNRETNKGVEQVELQCRTIITSFGSRVECLNGFDPLENHHGLLSKPGTGRGLYVSGWARNGPLGTIAATMMGAFDTARTLVNNIEEDRTALDEHRLSTHQLSSPDMIINEMIKNLKPVQWERASRIFLEEQKRGLALSKVSEKIPNVADMLKIE